MPPCPMNSLSCDLALQSFISKHELAFVTFLSHGLHRLLKHWNQQASFWWSKFMVQRTKDPANNLKQLLLNNNPHGCFSFFQICWSYCFRMKLRQRKSVKYLGNRTQFSKLQTWWKRLKRGMGMSCLKKNRCDICKMLYSLTYSYWRGWSCFFCLSSRRFYNQIFTVFLMIFYIIFCRILKNIYLSSYFS